MKCIDAGQPIEQFTEMGLEPSVLAALKPLGVTKPTKIQSIALPVGLAGGDIIAIAETGSGKTLAYALPILNRLRQDPKARAVVIVPTREIAVQVHKVFEDLCASEPITSSLIIGGVKDNKHNSQLKKNPKLIVATPGRLNDLLRNNKLLLQGVVQLVIDEADVMLDMGFSPQLKDIHATMRGTRQTLMFSASFTNKIQAVAELFMQSEEVVMIRGAIVEKSPTSLTQKVVFLAPGMKNQAVQDEINAVKGGVIVFTGNQEACEVVGRYLRQYSHSSDYLHGGLKQAVRAKVLEKFREQKTRILVTTDLLARGLDVPSVELVINFDLPPQPEDFLHRIGRTARMGRKGHAVTFVSPFEFRLYKTIKDHLAGAEEVSLDPKFKFVGDVMSTVAVPRAKSKSKKVKGGADGGKKKKKYGKLKQKSKPEAV